MNGSKSPGNDVRTKKLPQPNINLSREELLKLLSVFEGELQARDEVIAILKTERPNNPDIQSRYVDRQLSQLEESTLKKLACLLRHLSVYCIYVYLWLVL